MTRLLRIVCAAALVGVGLLAIPHADATSTPSTWSKGSYTNAAGTRTYYVHTPPNARAGLPLVVDLHGCTEVVADEVRRSHFNDVADKLGFIVAYPEQSAAANGSLCWNWFLPEHLHRGAGEPSLIAGITTTVARKWKTDPRRTYVFGISAGGAMANIMAVTYPDLYAAAGLYAACEYDGLPCLGAPPARPWQVSAQEAFTEMGPRARVIPIFVVQGSADAAVPAANSVYVVQQYLTQNRLVAGQRALVQPVFADHVHRAKKPAPNGQHYTVRQWHDARGRLVVEHWLIHGMGHQWSNAQYSGDVQTDTDNNDLILNDPNGPDVTTPIAQFLLAHPRTS
ncbi:MAG: hypothetical protein QOG53_540 [Frankiales bacterium]|jgi:poly(hydroxyalkanoate) depolymerase family esterase|nr:hypothetical protein [Frankiales bacterium]